MSQSTGSSSLLLPFETLLNRCIGQDARLAEGVRGLGGKTLQIDVTAPRLSLFVHFPGSGAMLSFTPPASPERVQPGPAGDTSGAGQPQADAVISGSATALLRLMTETDDSRALVNPAIQIRGEVEFVQTVYSLFKAMQVDWQGPLSSLLGDVTVHGLEQFLTGLKTVSRESTDSVKRSLDEYLHEESRLVPPLNRVEQFDRDLDTLRLRLDRLQARLALIDSHCDESPGTSEP